MHGSEETAPTPSSATYDTLHYVVDSMFAGLNVSERAWLDEENDLRTWRTEYGGRRSIEENEHENPTSTEAFCETSGETNG